MANKRAMAMIEKIGAILERCTTMGRAGAGIIFSYGGKRGSNYISLDELDDHPNVAAMSNRPDAVITTNPSFTMQDYKKQVLQIDKEWQSKSGPHELPGTLDGAAPLHSMEALEIFNEAAESGDVGEGIYEAEKPVLLVASTKEGSDIIGHILVTASAGLDYQEKRVSLHYNVNIIWVAPQFRGLGFGANLATSAGELCAAMYREVAKLLPSSLWTLDATVAAEYCSAGGEAAVERVYRELDYAEEAGQFKCSTEEVTLDAGY